MRKMIDSVGSIEQGVVLLREILRILKTNENKMSEDKEEYRKSTFELYKRMQSKKGLAERRKNRAQPRLPVCWSGETKRNKTKNKRKINENGYA